MTESKLTFDLSPLASLRRKLNAGVATRVGILGADASAIHDEDSGMTNAEIGVIHEFGSVSRNIPPRSFLRYPITEKKQEIKKFFNQKDVKEMVKKGQIAEVMTRLGFFAETLVQRAFETGGFGQWTPLKDKTVKAKGSSKPLIDTAELRRSITSDVVKD